ncbi:uncharacterized protein [Apostichopus japonicus]|uniref:uncharacterized protein n=1 Tax=Stichopus japonicus TaxID=307972 RepID=UPI003AB1B0A1
MSATSNLKVGQLLFEPKPPGGTSQNRGSPLNRRRVQSAKERLWKNVQKDGLRERPRSAAYSCEKTNTSKPPSGKFLRLLTGQNVSLNLGINTASEKKEATNKSTLSVSSELEGETSKSNLAVKSSQEHRHNNSGQSFEVPVGIAALKPWLTPNVDQSLIGIDPDTCLVFLPSMTNYDDLPVVPPVQDAADRLRYTKTIKEQKPFDPKKLFHYDVLKNRPHSADHVCNHKRVDEPTEIQRIYGENGKLLYDGSDYHRNRTKYVIKKEIEDLERLLQGIGNEDGTSIVVQYQHDINKLQASVKETLSQCNRLKMETETTSDLTGLRAYLREKERIIRRIRERRERCLEELEELEEEFGIQVTIVTQESKKGV